MAREETLVPSLTIAREVGDRKLVPLVGQKGGKSFLPYLVIKGRQGGHFLSPQVSAFLPEKQREKERREKRGRREEEGKKKGRKREEKGSKLRGFSS